MYLYIAMLLCAGGMIVAHLQYKKKGVVWGRPLSGMLGIACLVLALAQIVMIARRPMEHRDRLMKTDLQYAAVAMEYLGTHLGTTFPDHQILLITRPVTTEFKDTHEIMMEGFRKGLAGRIPIAAQVEPPRTVAELMAGGELSDDFVFTSTQFDQLVKMHPECNLIVSLIGLPKDFLKMALWTMTPEKRPKLVLGFANVFELKNAIKTDYISAAMIYNSAYRPSSGETVPDDLTEAFNRRYQLISKGNIDPIAAQNPRLFKPEAPAEGEEAKK